MGFTLFLAVLTILGNLIADVLYVGRPAYSGEVIIMFTLFSTPRRLRKAEIPALA
jgi:hypothetical protein